MRSDTVYLALLNSYQDRGDLLEDRFSQQLKKGVLEMLVLDLICHRTSYGYELLTTLKERSGGTFSLKEGTLYPILYRLEDDGLIESRWIPGEGRAAPKKMYAATDRGREENLRRLVIWQEFVRTVNDISEGACSDGT